MITYKLVFSKTGRSQWLGHLDVMRAFERAFRRSGIPVSLSQGHNPRPRLRFVFPSAVGMSCHKDILFVDIEEGEELPGRSPEMRIPCTDRTDNSHGGPPWLGRLNSTLPEGLSVSEAQAMTTTEAHADMASYDAAAYRVTCSCPPAIGEQEAIRALHSLRREGVIAVERHGEARTRQLELARYLLDADACSPSAGTITFHFVIRFGQTGTVRPTDLVTELGKHLPGLEVVAVERLAILKAGETPASGVIDGKESQ